MDKVREWGERKGAERSIVFLGVKENRRKGFNPYGGFVYIVPM